MVEYRITKNAKFMLINMGLTEVYSSYIIVL